MLYRVHLAWAGFELTTSVLIGTDCTGSCQSNYHTITTTTAPAIGICCFSTEHAALKSKSKNWLARNQGNVSKWSDKSTCILFQWSSTIKLQLSMLIWYKANIIIISWHASCSPGVTQQSLTQNVSDKTVDISKINLLYHMKATLNFGLAIVFDNHLQTIIAMFRWVGGVGWEDRHKYAPFTDNGLVEGRFLWKYPFGCIN
jgi:hypothetical protein